MPAHWYAWIALAIAGLSGCGLDLVGTGRPFDDGLDASRSGADGSFDAPSFPATDAGTLGHPGG